MRKAIVVYPYALSELNILLGDGWKVESTTPFHSQGSNPTILVILVREA